MHYHKIYGSKLLVLLIVLSSLLLTTSVMARTYWVNGVVTKAPWEERYRHIEIDHKLYTFMPKATISLRLKGHAGNYNEEELSWFQIKKGEKVFINIQGRRIYRLIIQR